METQDQPLTVIAAGTPVPVEGFGVTNAVLTGPSDAAGATIATEADVGGVSAQNQDGPAALPDHESLMRKLLEELEYVEHMGKSEIASVLAKFRALV
ncbi:MULTISPECIES: hypothetical protein [Pandoraea]|uniref:hypothetical protein n=1 Tax=Pandoraea TaxID=93217 RepID=UPI001F5C1F3D|nr:MULTISPECIES: hypothetical protein [Pandoraea]MCI3206555.1 hypothetical protein [Pandoraea sp. LA3]MDN4584583.1 hypothetical protein [Pandoraea capi]